MLHHRTQKDTVTASTTHRHSILISCTRILQTVEGIDTSVHMDSQYAPDATARIHSTAESTLKGCYFHSLERPATSGNQSVQPSWSIAPRSPQFERWIV